MAKRCATSSAPKPGPSGRRRERDERRPLRVRLTTVGTGTAAPSPTRVQSGHVTEGDGFRLLLDCGSGVAHRLSALHLDWPSLTHVAISHYHADHTLDLTTLLFAWRYGTMPPRTEPLTIVGPTGLHAFLHALAAAWGDDLLDLGYPVILHEIANGEVIALGSDAALAARTVPHTDASVAYSVEQARQRIVYTGDTGVDDSLGEWAAGCDVLLCECSLPDPMAIPTHLTPRQCGALARIASPGLLALTHFYPPVETVDIRAEVAEQFGGPVALTVDGWSHEIEEH